ncbi:MFS transporter [Phototrophicus methaneseepsis]|uniref:MFS transporter n=1 Tax=Phototrophicus methaneseepsis TaxID=2710758 RepID=A0A7S8E7U0_9CHLR|nr:MFS transporter [Phototrophicus methaneseepsis]QPC81978.1 MFS transporter [Phototrophicus methaneseepsis]
MATIAQTTHSSMFSALRHSNFRWYFGGQFISISGSWMQTLAEGWLVFQLTHSELALGLVACAGGIPSLFLSPFAGVIVDRFSRRNILIFTQTIQMILAFILSALVFAETVQVWHVVILAFVLGLTKCLDAPARQAFIKDMVGRDDMSSGITLNSIMVNGGRVLGPSLAGVLLAGLGAGWCFFVNGVTFLAVLFSLLMIHEAYRVPGVGSGSPIRQMREGLAFSLRHHSILPLLLLAAVGSIFAVNTVTLLPAFADVVLHSPVDGLSLLSAAQGVGAVIAGLLLTPLVNYFGHGRVVSVMILVWSFSLILLANSTQVPVAIFFMIIFGFAFVLFFVNTNTMIQLEVPDNYRGRVMSLFTLTFLGLTPLSALVIGALASVIGTPQTLVITGIINGSLALAILLRWRVVWHIA